MKRKFTKLFVRWACKIFIISPIFLFLVVIHIINTSMCLLRHKNEKQRIRCEKRLKSCTARKWKMPNVVSKVPTIMVDLEDLVPTVLPCLASVDLTLAPASVVTMPCLGVEISLGLRTPLYRKSFLIYLMFWVLNFNLIGSWQAHVNCYFLQKTINAN